MARISTYDQDSSLNKLDKLIGTDSATDGTKNFTISSLIQLINDLTAINFFDGLSYEYAAYDNDATDPEGLMNITGNSFITTPFSSISQLIVSKKGHNSPDIENYIRALNGSSIKISEQGDIDNFGVYKITAINDYTNDRYLQLTLTTSNSNGNLTTGTKYFFSSYQASIDTDLSDRTVTEFGDITDAGSGQIITTPERNKVTDAVLHSEVVNNLTSTSTDDPLSAAQGKVLKDLIDAINTLLEVDTEDAPALDTLREIVNFCQTNASTLSSLTISNISGLQTALNAKQNSESGKGLSTNDLTNALLGKLNGIASGAEVNVQTDWNGTGDAAILNKPTNFIFTSSSVADLNDVLGAGSGYIITDAERSKLSGIASGAEVNVNADWNATTGDAQILNKPTLAPSDAEANVQANWNETDTASDAFILNKPDISTKADKATTITVEGTTNEIEVTPNTAQDLSANRTITVGLPDDVTVSGDLTVNETIELANAQSTTPTFDNGIYYSTEDGHDVLHFRYHGHDLSIDYLTENIATGILNGGILSTNTNTTFDISAGDGVINILNKGATDPHPEIKKVAWTAQTGISHTLGDANNTDQLNTWVYIDSSGNVQQTLTVPSPSLWRNNIVLGSIIHSENVIRFVKTFPRTAYSNGNTVAEFIEVFGPLKKSGHLITANTTNTMRIDRAAGVSFGLGRNYQTDAEEPNLVSDGASTPSFHRYSSASGGFTKDDGTAGAGYADIDPSKYDNNGTLTTVSGGHYSVQRLYHFPNNTNVIVAYYGKDEYASINEAEKNYLLEDFQEAENTASQAIYLGAVIVKGNATDLTDSGQAKILVGGIFRSLSATNLGGVAADASLDDLSDVTISGPQNGEVLKYNSSTGLFENATDEGGIALTDLSVGTEGTASGNGAIDYDNTTGVFTYTPPAFVDGTGAADKVAVWTDADTLTNDTNLHWNSSSNFLGVNVSNPQKPLHVDGTIRLTSGTYGDWDFDRYYGNACLVSPSATTAFHFGTSANPSSATLTPVHLGKLGVGTTSPDASIDAGDNTDAIIVPKGTDAQRDALTAVSGMLRFNTTDNEFEGYDGTEWGAIGGSGGGTSTFNKDLFSGDDSTTSFTMAQSISDENNTQVYIDGVYQSKENYTINGTAINFSTAPPSGTNNVEVISISSLTLEETSTLTRDGFTGDGSTTAFTLSVSPANEDLTFVYIQGVYQEKSTYSLSGNTITFTTAPQNGYTFEVMSLTAANITQTSYMASDEFSNPTQGQTSFTLVNGTPSNKSFTMVFISGVFQDKSTYSLTSGAIVLSEGVDAEDTVEVISIGNGGVVGKAVSDANDARYSVNVISTNSTAVAGAVYVFTASLTLTLPASPEVGESIKISNRSGVATCVLGRNGNKILGAAADLTLDTASASFELIYSGTAQGWVIIGQ